MHPYLPIFGRRRRGRARPVWRTARERAGIDLRQADPELLLLDSRRPRPVGETPSTPDDPGPPVVRRIHPWDG